MEPKTVRERLFQQVNASSLGIFRFFFGAFMIIEMIYYFSIQFIYKAFIAPDVLFPYDYLEFIKPMPEGIMNALLGLMLVCAFLIMIGWKHRIAAAIFCLGNTYFLLLDKAIYNNHIYLFSLIAFLLVLTEASNAFSVRNGFSLSKKTQTIPNWQLWIFRFQIVVVYFYGGIAKLNPDWLFRQEPMKTVLTQLNGSLTQDWIGVITAYGSLFIDLGVGFLLLFKKTRWIAVIFLLIFHLSNGVLFNDIGIFPYLMIASTILFFSGEELVKRFGKKASKPEQSKAQKQKATKKELKRERKKAKKQGIKQPVAQTIETVEEKPVKTYGRTPQWAIPIVIAFVVFQLLFPLRHWLLPNNVDWTNVAQQFSWRMKIQTRKVVKAEVYVVDWEQQMKFPVDFGSYLNTMQRNRMASDPRMFLQFAEFMKKEAKREKGVMNPEIMATLEVLYNGRGPYSVFDSNKNLLGVDYSPFKKADWILEDE